MIAGAVPNTSNAPFFNPSKHSSLINKSMFSNAINLKFPTRKCSISLKTNAIATERSLYELLEISEEGSFEEIKKAYKQLARKYHPDVSPPDRTEEYTKRFIEVQEAYETLSDPNLRAIYDGDLARGLHLAFSGRRRVKEAYEERTQWRNKWEHQMDELKRRSTVKTNQSMSDENLSWGARMRRQRANSSVS